MDKNIRHNYNCYDSTTNYFLIIAVNCGVALLTAIMFMIVAGAIKMPYEQFIGTQGAIFASIVITPITYLGIYFVYHKRNQIKMFSKPQINVWYVLLAVAFGLICIFAVAPITNWLVYLFQKLGLKLDANLGFEMNTWWKIVLGIIGYAVLPAVAEELLYRKVILNGFLTKHTMWSSVIVTSVMFAIMHGSLRQFVYQIILGLILTLLAYVTKSVVYPIIMHFVNNLTVVILEITGGEFLVSGAAIPVSTTLNIVLYLLIAVVGIVLMVVSLWLINKRNNTKQPQDVTGLTKFTRNHTQQENIMLYAGLFLALIIWITNTIQYFK